VNPEKRELHFPSVLLESIAFYRRFCVETIGRCRRRRRQLEPREARCEICCHALSNLISVATIVDNELINHSTNYYRLALRLELRTSEVTSRLLTTVCSWPPSRESDHASAYGIDWPGDHEECTGVAQINFCGEEQPKQNQSSGSQKPIYHRQYRVARAIVSASGEIAPSSHSATPHFCQLAWKPGQL
jgi:hypothetical protein